MHRMMKVLKKVFRVVLVMVLLLFLFLGGVIGYAMFTDYQPAYKEPAVIETVSGTPELTADSIRLLIWNIGYAGLGKESDFFYDGGEHMRMSQELVEKNLEGIAKTLEPYKDQTDFFLLQEVDLGSRRSYYLNDAEKVSATLSGYSYAFGKNYDVRYIPIPLFNPMGRVLSGVATWSKYTPSESTRYNFEGNYDWPDYLFFLDRCFMLQRYSLPNQKELVLINTHNSAYDDGTLKAQQMAQLKAVLLEEYEKGHYVIVGGDWNQYPSGYAGVAGFPPISQLERFYVPSNYPSAGWQWVYDPQVPTNRDLATAFKADSTPRGIIDYYLLSPNVEVMEVKGRDLGFQYSDHQPVELEVRLLNLNSD